MRLRAASLDLKLAFDRVTPKLLYDALVDSATRPALAMALLCGKVGGCNVVSFQGITVDDLGFDRSIKQGGRESYLVRHGDALFAETSQCAARKERRQGYRTRTCTRDEDDDLLISNMIFADSCYILASIRSMLEMAQSATEKIMQCDLEWKANEMQSACWSSALDESDLEFTMHDVN